MPLDTERKGLLKLLSLVRIDFIVYSTEAMLTHQTNQLIFIHIRRLVGKGKCY